MQAVKIIGIAAAVLVSLLLMAAGAAIVAITKAGAAMRNWEAK